MTEKNQAIEKLKAKQSSLRKKIKSIKNSLPQRVLVIIFIGFCIVFYLEPKYYYWVGDGVKFVAVGLSIFVFLSLIYVYIRFKKIQSLRKEIYSINGKLYKLMKLDNAED